MAGGGEVLGGKDLMGGSDGVGLRKNEDAEVLEKERGVGESTQAAQPTRRGAEDGGSFALEWIRAALRRRAAEPVEGVLVDGVSTCVAALATEDACEVFAVGVEEEEGEGSGDCSD